MSFNIKLQILSHLTSWFNFQISSPHQVCNISSDRVGLRSWGTFFFCSATFYKASKMLYDAMWGKPLESRLLDVGNGEGLKFLPATEVDNLQLRKLGCPASSILFREEYGLTFDILSKHPAKSGGMVVTGTSGIGTNLLQKDMSPFANALTTCREIGLYILCASPTPKHQAAHCSTIVWALRPLPSKGRRNARRRSFHLGL